MSIYIDGMDGHEVAVTSIDWDTPAEVPHLDDETSIFCGADTSTSIHGGPESIPTICIR